MYRNPSCVIGENMNYYEKIIEKKNSLPEFKYCYQAMQWFKSGSQYAEVIDKLVDRFHLDKSTAAAAAQKGQQMYEDSYRKKSDYPKPFKVL